MLQLRQPLHSVWAILEHSLINHGSTLPFFLRISHRVCFTLPTGENLGSRSLERNQWQASEHSPQWTQVLRYTRNLAAVSLSSTLFMTCDILSGVRAFAFSSRPGSETAGSAGKLLAGKPMICPPSLCQTITSPWRGAPRRTQIPYARVNGKSMWLNLVNGMAINTQPWNVNDYHCLVVKPLPVAKP
jgi:hypothetical protein